MKRAWVAVLFSLALLHVSIPHAQDVRQFYLSPIDGAGTDADPWRSRCERGIDLRPFISINYFLCASNSLPSDTAGVVQIGASAKSSIAARKAGLAALVKKEIVADTVDDLVVEILAEKLRAGKDGKTKIYLGDREPFYQKTAWVPFEDGGLVADLSNGALSLIEPTLAWAATFTDSFNGADANLTGDLTWTEFTGTNWTRTGNVARAGSSTASAAEARAEHDTATDDQSVQADQTYNYTASGQVRCSVLARKDATGTRTYYGYGVQRDTGVDTYRIIHRVAGSPTTIADSAATTSSGTTIKLVVDGTSLSGYVNGAIVVGPVTDATISGNTRAGIVYVGIGGSDLCTLDNLEIKDYTATAQRRKAGALWF